jgi:hypothetical protein
MNKCYLKIQMLLMLCAVLWGMMSGAATAQQIGSGSQTKVGTTAAQFLGIGMGGRAVGMGGAFTAISDDINALYWNPAGIAGSSRLQLGINRASWLVDTRFIWAGITIPAGIAGTFGVAVTSLDYGTFDVTTMAREDGTGETFTAADLAVQLTWARMLTDRFSVGLTMKYINQTIYTAAANGFAIDAGFLFNTGLLPNGLKIGASVSNFGTSMRMRGAALTVDYDQTRGRQAGVNGNTPAELRGDEFNIPLNYRLGVSYDLVRNPQNRFTLAADALSPNDNTQTINLGTEYAWKDVVFFRGGYNALLESDAEKGWTLGAGLRYNIGFAIFRFDYTYQRFGRLNDPQWLAIGLDF